jgi:general secretion pathway protein G
MVKRTKYGRQCGYTLIEIVVALAILSVLVGVVTPFVQREAQRERERELRTALREIRSALDAYRQAVKEGRIKVPPTSSGYPKHLDDLVSGAVNEAKPEGARIYFLRRIPRDPFDTSSGASATQTWGLRSYASPAQAPAEGDDVFDVYSRSNSVGLNGVPYREW